MGIRDWLSRTTVGTPVADFNLAWDRSRCHITSVVADGPRRRAIHVVAFLAHLRRYFYLCDRIHRVPVYNYLCQNLMDFHDYPKHVQGLYDVLVADLSPARQQAAMDIFLGIAPIDQWIEAAPAERPLFWYRLRLMDNGHELSTFSLQFNLFGPLLSIPILYSYIASRLHSEGEDWRVLPTAFHAFLDFAKDRDLGKLPSDLQLTIAKGIGIS